MKKTLLISAISVAMAGMPIFQASAWPSTNKPYSKIMQEITSLCGDLKQAANNNPKTMNAIGLGFFAGGIAGAAKVLGKRSLLVRTGRGATLGSFLSAAAYCFAVPFYTDRKKTMGYRDSVDEFGYKVGLLTAAIGGLILS